MLFTHRLWYQEDYSFYVNEKALINTLMILLVQISWRLMKSADHDLDSQYIIHMNPYLNEIASLDCLVIGSTVLPAEGGSDVMFSGT